MSGASEAAGPRLAVRGDICEVKASLALDRCTMSPYPSFDFICVVWDQGEHGTVAAPQVHQIPLGGTCAKGGDFIRGRFSPRRWSC